MLKNTIELWDDPARQLHEKAEFICEMDNHDHAFLCGMLRSRRPEKILEIGVAEGGTTAVILNALSIIGKKCQVYSIDLSEELYYDNNKRTGYEYENLKRNIDYTRVKHQMLLGDTIAGQIDHIGNGIDFVIIDTLHKLPGEVLDFLCVLPYLNKEAVVVLHDINLNYERAVYGSRRRVLLSKESIATKLLFSVVTADKYLPIIGNNGSLPNIAAFMISDDTHNNIIDLFYALTFTWEYIPEKSIIEGYRRVYEKHYNKECLELFNKAVMNNRKIAERIKLAGAVQDEDINKYRFPYDKVPEGSKIVIYGAGVVGKEIYQAQKNRKLYEIVSWVDQNYKAYEDLLVERPETMLGLEFDYIVVAVEGEDTFRSILQDIDRNGWNRGKPVIGPIPEF